MKITLTKIYKSDKDKNGKPFTTKDGRNYSRLAIQAKEYGDQWLSGFVSSWNGMWRENDIVEVEIERVVKDGKEFLNFRRADPLKALEARIEKVEVWIKAEIAKKPKESTIKYPPEVDDYQEPAF